MSQLLIIFTKNPTIGKVKTRLAKTMGEEKALSIFKNLLAQATQTAKEWNGDVWVFYADFIPKKDSWTSVARKMFLQEGAGLGDRMNHAFQLGLASYKKVILMGTDIPAISPTIIEQSFLALENSDLVFGPTYDGGYYLVGMKQLHAYIFQNIQWSTPTVLEQSLLKVRAKDHQYFLVDQLRDIDYEEDLKDFDWLLK